MADKSKNGSAVPAKRNGAGRPTGYRVEYVAQAERLAGLGATETEIADFFNVNGMTIRRWAHQHPKFCAALSVGRDRADDRAERSLYQNAIGYTYVEQQAVKVKKQRLEGDKIITEEEVVVVEVERAKPAETSAAIFWLKNRKPHLWRDKHDFDLTVKDVDDVPVDYSQLDENELARQYLEAVGPKGQRVH